MQIRFRSHLFFLVLNAFLALCFAPGLIGCGGGGSSSAPPPSPTPDFNLSVSSSSINLAAGTSVSASVTITGLNGFTSGVTLQITGMPAGVTVTPANLQGAPGQPTTLSFTAVPYLSASTSTLTITGASGLLSHSATADLVVSPFGGTIPIPRTKYLRTDASTEYFQHGNTHWTLYDQNTSRFFVTDPTGNQVIAVDAATQTLITAIPVPGAFTVDETPDHSMLYVGTWIGDVYVIDPVKMQVTHRYISSQIGPKGYRAYYALVLANGKLALLTSLGGIPDIDGYAGFAIWDPADNSFTEYDSNGPSTNTCTTQGGIFSFSLTPDRNTIVMSAGTTLCTFNTVTGQTNSIPKLGGPITPTPDGKSFLVLEPGGAAPGLPPAMIVALDPKTLLQTGTFPLTVGADGGTPMFVSPDSSTLFLAPAETIVYAYDLATGKQTGWIPDLFVAPPLGGAAFGPIYSPDFQAMDSTGLLVGPMEEGVGFLDTAALQTGPVGTQFSNAFLDPAAGPSAGGTQFKVTNTNWANLAELFLGENRATSISQIGNMEFQATTPSGNPGYVDMYALMTDGGIQIAPEAFSYGPVIIQATPDSSTADGGGTGMLFGYGFGYVGQTSIPADLQVTIGGKSAQVTAFNPNAFNSEAAPFPLESLSYTIPEGVSGSSADIVVTNATGSTTLSKGMFYFPATQQIPISGANLAQGVYDATRSLYYFTDVSQIRVFSRVQGQWLTPLQVPAAPAGMAHRLWGLALSPDGTKLAVSDTGTSAIYLIDPSAPASVKSFPVATYGGGQPDPSSVATFAAGLAVSDAGAIYYAASTPGANDFDAFFKLDTNTGAVVDYGAQAQADDAAQYRVGISSDNASAFFNNEGAVFRVDTATDAIFTTNVDPGCCYGDFDLAVAPGTNALEATSYFYDSTLNAAAAMAPNVREALNMAYVDGVKWSASAALVFQPSTNGIDVYDGRLGNLRSRIALPFALSQNFDALVSDGQDNVLLAITGASGNGVAVIDLSAVSEPPALPYFTHATRPAQTAGLKQSRASTRTTRIPHVFHSVIHRSQNPRGPDGTLTR